MIDTVDIYFRFTNKLNYDTCFKIIDAMAKEISQGKRCLHKITAEKWYVTNAFYQRGFLQIAFVKRRLKFTQYFIKIFLKPARMFCFPEEEKLSLLEDYPLIADKFNFFIRVINRSAGADLLPNLSEWRATRIDYAINLKMEYTEEYLWLFRTGAIPQGFSIYENEEEDSFADSFYLTSAEGRINFYNKSIQLNSKNISLPAEKYHYLRLEFQCSYKYLNRLKSKYALENNRLFQFWNLRIARDVLTKRIKSIIGDRDFYPFSYNLNKIQEHYGCKRRFGLCCRLFHFIAKMKNLTEARDKFYLDGKANPNYFDQLLTYIRKAGVNPIILPDFWKVSYLPNPCRYVEEALRQGNYTIVMEND